MRQMLEFLRKVVRKFFKPNYFNTYCKKRVTFLLVTKNRAALLEKAIGRIKKLLGKNDELIIIDGDSSDDTVNVIKRHSDIVSKYISESDLSPAHAVNKGILLSSGKYIKLVTDDDFIYSRSMEKAIKIMELHQDIDILDCGGVRYVESTHKAEIIFKEPGINYGKSVNDIFLHGASGMGYIIRKSSLAKIGIFPVDIIGDITFIIKSILNGANVKFCRIKLYKQIIHKTNVSTRPEISSAIYQVVKKYAPRGFYARYAFNYFLWRHPRFKPVVSPLVFLFGIYKNLFLRPKQKARPKKFVWDAGFS